MEYSPTLCFAGFEYKISKSNKKRREGFAKVEMSRHKFRMSQHNFKGTSKYYVTTKMKLNSRLEVKIVATFHNFVVTYYENNLMINVITKKVNVVTKEQNIGNYGYNGT